VRLGEVRDCGTRSTGQLRSSPRRRRVLVPEEYGLPNIARHVIDPRLPIRISNLGFLSQITFYDMASDN